MLLFTRQVMELMTEHKVHRVYCVSCDTGKPVRWRRACIVF